MPGVVLRSFIMVIVLSVFSSVLAAQNARFTVRVVVPSSTPRNAAIYIAGNSPALGNWNPAGVQLRKLSDSVWAFAAAIPVRSLLEFKITRGSWETEALYVPGVVPPNIVVRVISDTTITLQPVTWRDFNARGTRGSSSGGIVGTVRYHRGLKGEGLNYARDVIVWLPPSYFADPQKRYPVLYMHDGQNVFDPSTSYLGFDWRADDVADSLIRAQAIHEIIIVGIYNTADRIPEYSDTPLGRSYARFVVGRLKPFIDSTYRTRPARENTAVMGSSMGGLISLLFAWWHPDVYSMAGCLSTAIMPGSRDEILTEIRRYSGPRKNLRVYIDVGGLEDPLIPGYEALKAALVEKGHDDGVDLQAYLDSGAVHNELAWAHRFWRPLKFMFGR